MNRTSLTSRWGGRYSKYQRPSRGCQSPGAGERSEDEGMRRSGLDCQGLTVARRRPAVHWRDTPWFLARRPHGCASSSSRRRARGCLPPLIACILICDAVVVVAWTTPSRSMVATLMEAGFHVMCCRGSALSCLVQDLCSRASYSPAHQSQVSTHSEGL